MSWTVERLGEGGGPVLVAFIHGGFWRARYDLEAIGALARAAAQDGLEVWNLEYPRVGMPGGGWPGTLEAVGEAVRAAAGEAAGGGRPLALVGHSAGGHLALWAARDAKPALVVSLAGVCDLVTGARQEIGERAVLELMGAGPDSDPERYRSADPLQRLPLGAPALLIHGDRDDRVPVEQSRTYAAAAQAAGDVCELCELPGADHFELVDPEGRAWPIARERLLALAD